MKIHKFILNDATISIDLPQGSEILTAQLQDAHVVLWVKMTDDPFIETRTISIFLTGGKLPEEEYPDQNMKYINTVQGGFFVYHIFEVIQ